MELKVRVRQLAICMFWVGCAAAPRDSEVSAILKIRVDPRVELFSTIHRLAGTAQYDEQELPEYIQDVETHFGQFRDHRAVRMAVELRENHDLDGNSPMSLAVYLAEPPGFAERVPLRPLPAELDRRWSEEAASKFLEATREFALETDFIEFFKSHSNLYNRSVQNLEDILVDTDIRAWFRAFFGFQPENYIIIIGLQNGVNNYGAKVRLEDGTHEFFSILGATRPDEVGAPQYDRRWVVPLIVHEFCHSYVNPLVYRNLDKFRGAGERIYAHLEQKQRRWGYNKWYVMVQEYLVRACVFRYLAEEEGPGMVTRMIRYDEQAGFPEIRGLNDRLTEYEQQRSKYTSLQDFLPRLVDFFQGIAESWEKREYQPPYFSHPNQNP